jgi:hypothetical protein
LLYDPAGSYSPPSYKETNTPRGLTDNFTGDDAKLEPYIAYQHSVGSDTQIAIFNTTPGDEKELEAPREAV